MYLLNKLNFPVTLLNERLDFLPVSTRMTILCPVILFLLILTLLELPLDILLMVGYIIFEEKKQSLPTPRDIYLRTGFKVNGYNGYMN